MSAAVKEWEKDEKAEGKVEGGFAELGDLVIDGDLSLNKAVARAEKYGITDEEDFRKRALLLGKKI